MSSSATPPAGFVTIHVADVWRTQQWYQDVFGLMPKYLAPDGSYVELAGGGFVLALCTSELGRHSCGDSVQPATLSELPHGFHLSFVATDLAGTYARALLLGALPVSPPARKPWGRQEACLRDANGILVVLLETLDPNPTGPAPAPVAPDATA